MLAALSAPALGSGPHEPPRSRSQVTFADGSSLAVSCSADDCAVIAEVDSVRYAFPSTELKAMPVPSDGKLFVVNAMPDEFSFEIEVLCDGFPEDSTGACFGNYLVRDGRIAETHWFTRLIGPMDVGSGGSPPAAVRRWSEAAEVVVKNGSLLPDVPPDGVPRTMISVKGEGARRIYEAIPGPELDECHHPVVRMKFAGKFVCSRSGDRYECTTGIDLESGEPQDAFAC